MRFCFQKLESHWGSKVFPRKLFHMWFLVFWGFLIPASHRISFSFPRRIQYSRRLKHSSIVPEIPRLIMTALSTFPNRRVDWSSGEFRARSDIYLHKGTFLSIWEVCITSVTILIPAAARIIPNASSLPDLNLEKQITENSVGLNTTTAHQILISVFYAMLYHFAIFAPRIRNGARTVDDRHFAIFNKDIVAQVQRSWLWLSTSWNELINSSETTWISEIPSNWPIFRISNRFLPFRLGSPPHWFFTWVGL